MPQGRNIKSIEACKHLFLSKINKKIGLGPNGNCWEWIASTYKPLPYGQFGSLNSYSGRLFKETRAHRIAYKIRYPDRDITNVMICHKCDNPRCCRPSHLFRGDALTNMLDKKQKHRQSRVIGCSNGMALLTETDVIKIRKSLKQGRSQRYLAKKFNVTHGTIGHIARKQTWKHIK